MAKPLEKLESELTLLNEKLSLARQKITDKKAEIVQAKRAKTDKSLSKLDSDRIDFLIDLAGVDDEKMKTIRELLAD